MIWTVLQVNLRRLLHNRVELLLTFVVPIAFFSIFALIFGGGLGPGTTPKIKIVAVDEVDSAASRAVIESLQGNEGLRFMRDENPASISRQEAREMVQRGSLTMAVVLNQIGNQLDVDLLSDSSDQVAGQVVTSLVARSLMIVEAEQRASGLWLAGGGHASVPGDPIKQVAAKPAPTISQPAVADRIELVDVIGEGKSNPVVSVYAAGIAVMFLLFGASGGGIIISIRGSCSDYSSHTH